MAFIDYFAILVLAITVLSGVAILVALGMAPGHIARKRGHPWADAVEVAGWAALVFGLVLWPVALVWAFVDAPARPATDPHPDRPTTGRSRAAVPVDANQAGANPAVAMPPADVAASTGSRNGGVAG